ncbi:MAG: PAS domain-containing protein [Candidatus Doudnabacteria bacterium]|nr:PAS domain-containing protein [Candidatus Doudnabacteria bacterium]
MPANLTNKYKKSVEKKLAALRPVFARALLGDFTGHIDIPEKDDEFTELYVGLETILEVIRKQLNQAQRQDAELKDKFHELEFQNLQNEAILESLGDGLLVVDEREQILVINKQMETLLKQNLKAVTGKNPADIFILEDENGKSILPSQRPLRVAMATGKKVSGRYYITKHDGAKFPVEIISTPLLLSGTIIGGTEILRDITQEMAIDKAKSEFVSLASHQLRTPLTVIKWRASQLLDSWEAKDITGASRKKFVEEIYRTNQRMIELVNAILNVSKIDLGTLAIEPEQVNLQHIAEEVLNELAFQIKEKKLHLDSRFDIGLPLVNADPNLMRVIFQNLLTNSVKYTPVEGKIICDIKVERDNFLITIADTGCGIPLKDQEKIYDKFHRTEAAKKIDPNGNGLGMYIVKSIIDEVGGKIWFNSQEGEGTSFFVSLPLSGMKRKEETKQLTELFK